MKWNDLYFFQKLELDVVLMKFSIIKYNYALDDEIQNFGCQDAFIEITENAKAINIFNKKIVLNNDLVLESDPNKIEKLKRQK